MTIEPSISTNSTQGYSRRSLFKGGAAIGLGVFTSGTLGSMLTACGSTSVDESTKSMQFALANSFTGFNPQTAPGLGSRAVINHVFDTLLLSDPVKLKVSPRILETMPEKAGKDRYEARVRPGLTFHDGSELTANDCAFTIEYMKDPDNAAYLGAFLALIKKVKTDGPKVIIEVEQEFAALPSALSIVNVMPRTIVEKMGSESYAKEPVGSGPFKLENPPNAAAANLAAYRDYGGSNKPKLSGIDFLYIEDPSTRESQLKTQQIDVMENVPYRDVKSLHNVASVETGSVVGTRNIKLEFNHANGPTADKKVRQALLYAMNREEIIERIFDNKYAEIADSLLRSDSPYYREPKAIYRYDPNKAKQLLKHAGHPDGFELEFMIPTVPYLAEVGQLLAEQWKGVGIRVKLQKTEIEAGYSKVADKKYQAFLAYANEAAHGFDPDIVYRLFMYGRNREGTFGSNGPTDKKFDELLDRGLGATTHEERIEAYGDAQDIVSETVMNNFPLMFVANIGAWRDSVKGYKPSPVDVPTLRETSTD